MVINSESSGFDIELVWRVKDILLQGVDHTENVMF